MSTNRALNIGRRGARKRSVAPPSSYSKDYHIEHIYKLVQMGLTKKKIAEFFDIGEDAIETWRQTHTDFRRAWKSAEADMCMVAVESLIDRVTGYDYEETKVTKEGGNVVREEVTAKQMPPDVNAAKFLLAKKMPDVWGDKQVISLEGEVKVIQTLAEKLTNGSKR